MPTALCHARFGQSAINAESGVITGVKVMCLGRLAQFAGEDGKPKTVTITAAHIDALLSHAGNRAIPSHLTHDWFTAQGKSNADTVEMGARIGALKAFRKDDAGDLIGDAHLRPGNDREAILWSAEHNPEDTMLSAVFSYAKNDPLCMPIDFRAVDFVPSGAAVTALFSEANPNSTMDISELIAMLDDPKVKVAIKAILKSHEDASDTADADAAESDAGVTDADKKPEDDTKPALMRAQLRVSRAIRRQTGELAKTETAILAKARVQAGAETTALLGKGGFIKQGGDNGNEIEGAIAAQITAGAKNRAVAIMRLAKDKPELYNSAREAGKL